MTESTMDPSMWRERAQRAEAEVERLSWDNTALLNDVASANEHAGAAEDRLRKVAGKLGRLIECIERECEGSEGSLTCHEYDRTDDGKCALAADLEATAVLAAPPAEGSKIPSSRIGEADRSAPEAAEDAGDCDNNHHVCSCYPAGVGTLTGHTIDCNIWLDAPAPVSSGEAGHDEVCEADFILEAGAWTPCRCAERAPVGAPSAEEPAEGLTVCGSMPRGGCDHPAGELHAGPCVWNEGR